MLSVWLGEAQQSGLWGKGSGAADLCTQAINDGSGCPTADTTPQDLTAATDNSNEAGHPSLQAATLTLL